MSEKNQGISIIGLDRAGKSVIMNFLTTGDALKETKPTLAINYASIILNRLKCPFYDTPGQKSLRIYWDKVVSLSKYLLFVIDVSDLSRYSESFEELVKILKKPDRNYNLFILFHKIDLPESSKNIELAKELFNERKILSFATRSVHFFETSIAIPDSLIKVKQAIETQMAELSVTLASTDETMFNTIFNSTSDMIWAVDAKNYGLLVFNKSLSDYFSLKRKISIQIGMRPVDLFPEQSFVDKWVEFYQKTLKCGPYTTEYVVYTNNIVLQLQFNLLKRDNSVFAISVFGKDITKEKQIESQLNQAKKLETIGNFASEIAHDFANLIGAIKGFSEIALDMLDPKNELHQNLEEINKTAVIAVNLSRELLTFARKQPNEPKLINVNEIIEGMLKLIQQLIGAKISLIWRPITQLWQIKMDPNQINQIIMNLCCNARDAMSGEGSISIETQMVSFDEKFCSENVTYHPGDFIQINIGDSGQGMSDETKTRLFEPFFTTKSKGKGTGLGLAIVYGIVTQNRGFIDVTSQLGKGTMFKIFLPRYVET